MGTWGGKRKGSGRKRKTDQTVIYHVRITQRQALLLKQWGGGDISWGLRWLISAAEPFIRREMRRHD